MEINRHLGGRVLGVATIVALATGAAMAAGSAGAVESIQADGTAASVPAAAVSLPAFLDSARVPDLHNAWRARFGFSDVKPVTADVEVINSKPHADAVVMQSARDAMTRAEKVSQETAAVRARAEELSSRFETPAAEVGITPAAEVGIVAHAVATIPIAARTEDLPAPMMIGAPSADAAPLPAVLEADEDVPAAYAGTAVESQAKPTPTSAAPAVKDEAAKPVKRVERAATVAPARTRTVAAVTTRPAPITVADEEPPEPRVDNSGLPTEIRAFGWNAQPQ